MRRLASVQRSFSLPRRASKCILQPHRRLRCLQNFQVIEIEKAPQVGLEPTTLWLTEGLQVVAGSCGLLPIHSSCCFYRFLVLLISITFCFDLPAFASFKRQHRCEVSRRSRSWMDDSRTVASLDCTVISLELN